MTSSVNFGLISYNTHLFFPDNLIPDFGPLFADSDRKTAIDQQYLELVVPYSKSKVIQIAAIQEVWYSSFAHDITKDVARHGSYKNEYVVYRSIIPPLLNPSGLILLADPVCSFHEQKYFDYITHCEAGGWDPQDLLTGKGFLKVKCDFPADEHKVALGLFTTHMPTNFGKHPKSVTKCFEALAEHVISFRKDHPAYAVIVLGDLNVDSGSDKYKTLVTDILLAGDTGLKDAATLIDPGYTINPKTNTLWQHFNPGKEDEPPKRIDYLFFADSYDGVSQQVELNSFAVKTDGLTVVEKGSTYNCSDHYPIEASITIKVTT